LVIGGRPANLKAFGTVEFDHPQRNRIRCWDVVITTDKPDEIEFKDTGVLVGETLESDAEILILG